MMRTAVLVYIWLILLVGIAAISVVVSNILLPDYKTARQIMMFSIISAMWFPIIFLNPYRES